MFLGAFATEILILLSGKNTQCMALILLNVINMYIYTSVGNYYIKDCTKHTFFLECTGGE